MLNPSEATYILKDPRDSLEEGVERQLEPDNNEKACDVSVWTINISIANCPQ